MGFRPKNQTLEDFLVRIETLCEKDDMDTARKELTRALKRFPDDLALREWEAVFAAEEERFEEALAFLDSVLEAEPLRPFAVRERASVLMEMGRFVDAVESLRTFLEADLAEGDAQEEAEARYDLAASLDHLGRVAEADAEFQRAARLAPDDFPVPPRMTRAEFEDLVAKALDSIPSRFEPYLRQVAVTVEDYPSRDEPGPFILGLYDGVPRTERTHDEEGHLDRVFIYKRNHELLNLPREEVLEEVRKTVIHEIAHHFGLGEEDMGEYA